MRILHLTLKKKWFDMIASGEKKEEYREIKTYWQRRLIVNSNGSMNFNIYDRIVFKNGYAKDSPELTIECKGVSTGEGKPQWGAPKQPVFIIKLGDII